MGKKKKWGFFFFFRGVGRGVVRCMPSKSPGTPGCKTSLFRFLTPDFWFLIGSRNYIRTRFTRNNYRQHVYLHSVDALTTTVNTWYDLPGTWRTMKYS